MDETETVPQIEPKKIKKVRYFAVELSTGQPVANFVSDSESAEFAESEFFKAIYGEAGIVVPVMFNVYDLSEDAEEALKKSIVESAMSKLTSQERYVLGL
jgi:hypothetical protein